MSQVKNWQLGREMEYPYDESRPKKQWAIVFDLNKSLIQKLFRYGGIASVTAIVIKLLFIILLFNFSFTLFHQLTHGEFLKLKKYYIIYFYTLFLFNNLILELNPLRLFDLDFLV